MAEQYNPLREWRGERSQSEAAVIIGCDLATYVVLEMASSRIRITSENILHVQKVTHIPLPVLVDWLTETTKEMA